MCLYDKHLECTICMYSSLQGPNGYGGLCEHGQSMVHGTVAIPKANRCVDTSENPKCAAPENCLLCSALP